MSDLAALLTPAPYTVPRAPGTRVRRPTVPVANPRVRPVTRWMAALVVFFLADAAQLLLLLPHRTAELFAWPIDARLSSFVLASAYVGGGYFFIRVAMGGDWRRVAAGLPAVIVFVWLAALATALHLDRFTHDSVAFVAWAAIYLVAPFGLPLLLLSQRGRATSRDPLPAGARRLMLLTGGAVTMAGLLLFALPQPAIDVWPGRSRRSPPGSSPPSSRCSGASGSPSPCTVTESPRGFRSRWTRSGSSRCWRPRHGPRVTSRGSSRSPRCSSGGSPRCWWPTSPAPSSAAQPLGSHRRADGAGQPRDAACGSRP